MIDFDLRQLQYFVCAARAGSYSQAARELYVTPQAISRSIQLLEGRLGERLFSRTPNGIALTELGQACLQPAQEAIEALERLHDVARFHADRRAKPSLVLAIHSLCFKENGGSMDRGELLAFKGAHDDEAAFSFVEMSGGAIMQALRQGTADFGVTVPPLGSGEEFAIRPLRRFDIAALVSQGFEGHFARQGDRVTLGELQQGELVSFTDEMEYNSFLQEYARRAGRELPVSSLSVSPHGDMGFLAGSQLYAVRPLQHALRTVHDERLRILPIVDDAAQPLYMPLGILMKAGRVPTKAEETLLAYVASCYR